MYGTKYLKFLVYFGFISSGKSDTLEQVVCILWISLLHSYSLRTITHERC